MNGVFLNGEAVLAENIRVLHRNEAGKNGDVVFGGEDVSPLLQGLGLAVIPPHALLGIDQNEVTVTQKGAYGVREFFEGLVVRGEGQGVAVSHQIAVEAGE